MNGTRSMRLLAIAAVMILTTALSARAQITTGSVAGTVVDAQGGVIPGATVILTNTAQGTKSNPVVTSAAGDFVIPNVPAGTYTLDVRYKYGLYVDLISGIMATSTITYR